MITIHGDDNIDDEEEDYSNHDFLRNKVEQKCISQIKEGVEQCRFIGSF